jgi:hypothetical protein
VFVLAIMAGHPIHVLDVQGAFLNGDFEDGEKIYMVVPREFEKYYDPNPTILLLVRTLYGLIQAAIAFWRKLVLSFAKMGFKRSKADSCLFYRWTSNGVVLWMVVVDDSCGVGPETELLASKRQLMDIFACEGQGHMKEYIGNKIVYDAERRMMNLTHPVLVQSLSDEFRINKDNQVMTPGIPGKALSKGEMETGPEEHFLYRKGTGKLIHLQKWSRPDIINATRDLARFMSVPSSKYSSLQALNRNMSYVVQTPERGLVLHPDTSRD